MSASTMPLEQKGWGDELQWWGIYCCHYSEVVFWICFMIIGFCSAPLSVAGGGITAGTGGHTLPGLILNLSDFTSCQEHGLQKLISYF